MPSNLRCLTTYSQTAYCVCSLHLERIFRHGTRSGGIEKSEKTKTLRILCGERGERYATTKHFISKNHVNSNNKKRIRVSGIHFRVSTRVAAAAFVTKPTQ